MARALAQRGLVPAPHAATAIELSSMRVSAQLMERCLRNREPWTHLLVGTGPAAGPLAALRTLVCSSPHSHLELAAALFMLAGTTLIDHALDSGLPAISRRERAAIGNARWEEMLICAARGEQLPRSLWRDPTRDQASDGWELLAAHAAIVGELNQGKGSSRRTQGWHLAWIRMVSKQLASMEPNADANTRLEMAVAQAEVTLWSVLMASPEDDEVLTERIAALAAPVGLATILVDDLADIDHDYAKDQASLVLDRLRGAAPPEDRPTTAADALALLGEGCVNEAVDDFALAMARIADLPWVRPSDAATLRERLIVSVLRIPRV